MFGEYITVGDALLVTAISITIVFFILLLIALAIYCFKFIPKEEVKAVAKKVAPKTANSNTVANVSKVDLEEVAKDENKVVAMLVATMEANTEETDKKYKVVSIREV
ncbi:MAG: OadG family transporter subunit [Lachnospirales bacterium]